MAQTTITLSFDVAALVPDELPGPEALRSAVEDELSDYFWVMDVGHKWGLERINTTPPPAEPLNDELLRSARHHLARLELDAGAVLNLRAAVDAVMRAKIAAATSPAEGD